MKVEIFEPPMCCPTGLCGPTVDPVLLDINEMALKLKAEGVQVERYMLSAQPQAFVSNTEVYRLVRERQIAALPITLVNGRVIKTGAYADMQEVRQALES